MRTCKGVSAFDQKSQTFNIEAARHQEFLASLTEHKKDMTETVRQLTEAEKAFEMLPPEEDSSFKLILCVIWCNK